MTSSSSADVMVFLPRILLRSMSRQSMTSSMLRRPGLDSLSVSKMMLLIFLSRSMIPMSSRMTILPASSGVLDPMVLSVPTSLPSRSSAMKPISMLRLISPMIPVSPAVLPALTYVSVIARFIRLTMSRMLTSSPALLIPISSSMIGSLP